jgi:hypothetical protein
MAAMGAAKRTLEAKLETAGREWAASVRLELHRQGRRAAGGWPGTMSEARAQIVQSLGAPVAPPPDELGRLARILYGAARTTWLMQRDAADDDED